MPQERAHLCTARIMVSAKGPAQDDNSPTKWYFFVGTRGTEWVGAVFPTWCVRRVNLFQWANPYVNSEGEGKGLNQIWDKLWGLVWCWAAQLQWFWKVISLCMQTHREHWLYGRAYASVIGTCLEGGTSTHHSILQGRIQYFVFCSKQTTHPCVCRAISLNRLVILPSVCATWVLGPKTFAVLGSEYNYWITKISRHSSTRFECLNS